MAEEMLGLSPAYNAALAAARAHHAQSKTYSGRLMRPHAPYLSDLVKRLNVTSALDYGAGKGAQWTWVRPESGKTLEEEWGFNVRKYDPAWPPFAAEPEGAFELVIATHVLGSIPIGDLPLIIERLYALATKAVFIAEQIGPVKKTVFAERADMPRGFNSMDWLDAIAPHAKAHSGIETHLAVRYKNACGSFTGRFRL